MRQRLQLRACGGHFDPGSWIQLGVRTVQPDAAALRSLAIPFGFEAADAIVAADRRYEWRYVDGVVLLRPAAAWRDPSHPLLRTAPSVYLDHVTGAQALDAVRIATGHPTEAFDTVRHAVGPSNELPTPPFGDEERANVDFAGGTVLQLLAAIVRCYGKAYWSLESTGHTGRAGPSQPLWVVEPVLSLNAQFGGPAHVFLGSSRKR